MAKLDLGTQGMTDEDRAYAGSRFSEVIQALFENPYQRVWGAPGEPPFPAHEVTFEGITQGILPGGPPHAFQEASARALDSGSDLRWGVNRKGFRRIVHPNGLCLIGTWQITAETPYTGYFAKGSRALAIGRYSTCCTETHRGQTRSLSLVGKIYPTTDPNHATPLRTANFMTQQDIGGDDTEFINDAVLRNAPDTTAARRAGALPTLLVTGLVFNHVDKQPSIRQLYQISELGLAPGQPGKAPAFMQLLVAPTQPRIAGSGIDFRDELMAQIFDKGDPAPKRTLTFNIEVTDDGETTGTAVNERRTFKNWRPIGTLTFDNAVASYNSDFVIHFHHPTWREDRNDPATATRVNERKVERSS